MNMEMRPEMNKLQPVLQPEQDSSGRMTDEEYEKAIQDMENDGNDNQNLYRSMTGRLPSKKKLVHGSIQQRKTKRAA